MEECAPRFKNEDLAIHWQVDESEESLRRLLYHLEVRSNFRPYFEEALASVGIADIRFPGKNIVVADIGAGVGWTSAIMALDKNIKLVYAVDPSDNRLKHAKQIVRHFGVENKVNIVRGTFLNSNVPEKVDLVLLCGSLHHCRDNEIAALFSNIGKMLVPGGIVLIANEHYVDWR